MPNCAFDLEDSLSKVNIVVIVVTAVSFLLGVIITWLITRRLNCQLGGISEYAGKVAAGDLNAKLEGAHPEELELVKVEIERMVINLKQRLGLCSGCTGRNLRTFSCTDY